MKRRQRLCALAAGVITAGASLTAGTAAAAPPPAEPAVKLVAGDSTITLDRDEDTGRVYLELGAHAVAGDEPFEFWLKRPSFRDPITAVQKTGNGERPLPAGMFTDFRGLPEFTHVRFTNAAGKHVVQRYERFCPNSYEPARVRPDAPDRSSYPWACRHHQFALGAVWGLQEGWATPLTGYGSSVKLPEGKYTVTLTMAKRYRDLFDIPLSDAQVKIRATVRDGEGHGEPPFPHATATQAPQPADAPPTGRAAVPPEGPKANLRSLPAWGVKITTSPGKTKQYVAFAANVWNAGPSPLVVDGFRRSGKDIMDAYQYFYDDKGNQVGYAPAGTMEWDARDGHHHWHFTDFAQYRLLKADGGLAVRSKKEAFCLANTDAIDYTVPNANWRPENTDLHTACGGGSSLAVREVLDVGSGDTYGSSTPGQAIDITTVPNGTYLIEVRANPRGVLHESDTTDNVSLRKITLGGTKGKRTVKVAPWE